MHMVDAECADTHVIHTHPHLLNPIHNSIRDRVNVLDYIQEDITFKTGDYYSKH